MKTPNPYCFILAILLPMLGCSKKLPDAYGLYADTNRGQILLSGQVTRVAGTYLSPIQGVDGPSGAECRSLKDFIVYQKDVQPSAIGISQMQFYRYVNVPNILGGSIRTQINLWLPQNRIDVEVRPVEQRPDMYIIVPKVPLEKGFYTIYIGSFGGDMGFGSRVFDIVVGSYSDFPSAVMADEHREEEIHKNASVLITRINQMLNIHDYKNLGDVYRPNGGVLSGAALQEFIDGNQTWLNSAGRIIKSEVGAVTLLDEANARVTIVTIYEKLGRQSETATIRKEGDQYFITEIK
jgi:hypothetical protein